VELISTNEVCAILNISKNNLHQIQYRGQIKWIEKRGKSVFYDRAQVEAYKAKRDNRQQ